MSEKFIVYILLLLPGFIALKTANALGHHTYNRGNLDNILSYMIFGIVSDTIILSLMSPASTWQELAEQSIYLSFVLKYLLLSLVISIFIGAAWSIFINKWLLQLSNRANVQAGKNEYFMGTLLQKLFDDGKRHFLIIQKNGQDVGIGFFYGLAVNQQGQTEIALTEYPEYRIELHRARAGKPSYLANRLQTYINSDTGAIIYETEYPPEWAAVKQEQRGEAVGLAE